MKINVVSVVVDNQAKALRFYTDVLGFLKKREIPVGEHSWLTEPESRPRAWPPRAATVIASST